MSFFAKNQNSNEQPSERQSLETKFANSRHNILLVVIFSVINIVLLVSNSNTYFLFSAYVPYLFADLGMLLSGMYPTEYYDAIELTGMEFLGKEFLGVMLAIVAVILILYMLSWVFSKKNRIGWMIFALVIFVLDTVLLLLMNGIVLDMILDYVFHGWVIVSLFMGISAGNKLKKLPEETECPEPIAEIVGAEEPQPEE